MKKNFLIMAMLLAGQQAMAAPLLALPPVPKLLALPPCPLKKNITPLLKLFKSKGVSSTIRSFLSFEDENALSLSGKICAQGQKHLKISYNTPREEDLLDIFLRKDISPCLESFIVEGRGYDLVKEKIVSVLEKNKKTLRKVVLPEAIFPETKIRNGQGLTPVDEKGIEKRTYCTNVHLKNFPNLETLKIFKTIPFMRIRLFLLEGMPNLKIVDIEGSAREGSALETKILENLSLTELNINYADLKDQDNPFAHLPLSLKKLSMNEVYHQGKSVENLLPLFIDQLDRFKNLEYLFFDVFNFGFEIKTMLERLPLLKQLHIAGFARYEDSPKNLEGLSDLKNLTHLSLIKAKYLEDFSEIFKLTKLEYLDLSGSSFNEFRGGAVWLTSNITNESLMGIENLQELRYLGLERTGVTNLNSIQNLKKLEHLNLALSDIKSLRGIQNLENLRILDLSYKLNEEPNILRNLLEIKDALKNLLEMEDAQLSKLTVFLGAREKIPEIIAEAVTALKQKGVRFLQPYEGEPLLWQWEDPITAVGLNTIEMAKAYIESPFLNQAYRRSIEH